MPALIIFYLHLGQMTYGIYQTKLISPMVMNLYSEELENEFGFSPIVARALLNKIDFYNASRKAPIGAI
jgi:hypothetical protein